MTSAQLEVALAQLFRKKGRSSMTEKDFVFAASLDLRWFTPKEAQKLFDLAMGSELLEKEGDKVRPGFDYKAVEVPLGYKPDKDVLKAQIPGKGLFMKIVEKVASDKGLDRKEIVSMVNRAQEMAGVEGEVAALMVARSLDADVSEFLDQVEEEVGKRYKQ